MYRMRSSIQKIVLMHLILWYYDFGHPHICQLHELFGGAIHEPIDVDRIA